MTNNITSHGNKSASIFRHPDNSHYKVYINHKGRIVKERDFPDWISAYDWSVSEVVGGIYQNGGQ